MKKVFKVFGIIVITALFAFTMMSCDEEKEDEKVEPKWWKFQKEDAAVTVIYSPSSDDTACDIAVTGTSSGIDYAWHTQIGVRYTATAGKTYKVSFKWKANNSPFQNVVLRYARKADTNTEYFMNSYSNTVTVPTAEETKSHEFTMPADCDASFTFLVGGGTGSFRVWDFKVEEKN